MSTITTGSASAGTSTRTILAGVAAAAAGVALVVYAAYGDSHAQTTQKSAVPFLVVVVCVAAALAFGLLLPRVTRPGASRRWGIVTGIVALVLTPVVFWSGVPLVLGTVAAVGGRRASSTATAALGVLAVALSVVMAVLGNTVLSSS